MKMQQDDQNSQQPPPVHLFKPVNEPIYPGLAEPLPIESVEFRVQSISSKGWATLLAYKDARVDMDRLDQIVGPDYWQRDHQRIDGREYCHVRLWNPVLKQWVTKSDVGVPSNTEAVKGEASDAFKRACFNWGIGRELYAYPLLIVQLLPGEFEVHDDRGKQRGRATFGLRLKEWTWKLEWEPDAHGRQRIKQLAAIDQNSKLRFRWPRGAQDPEATGPMDDADAPARNNRGTQQQGNRGRQQNNGQRGNNAQRGGGNRQQPQGGDNSQQRAPRGNQNQGAQQQPAAQKPADADRPWFDEVDTEEFKVWAKQQFKDGKKADAVIAIMKQKYRLNRQTENKIRDLAVQATSEKLGAGGVNDQIP